VKHPTHTIKPYWHDGAWVFDDPARGWWAKPFVTPFGMVDQMLRQAGLQARQPFVVIVGDRDDLGPGYRLVLERIREDREGHWYVWDATEVLCPALIRYFDAPPARIYCLVTARRTPFSVMQPDRGDARRRLVARDVPTRLRRSR